MPQYEAWCHNCNVTVPPEQKRCLHCGGATRPDTPRRGFQHADADIQTAAPITFETSEAPVTGFPDLTVSAGSDTTEEEPVRRSLLRAGMTVMWMVLLIAGYAYRACSQQ